MRLRVVDIGILAVAAAYFVVVIRYSPMGPVREADSASYLGFSPIRTAGYPLFLRLVGTSHLIAAQTALHAFAVACLGVETRRLMGSAVWSWLLVFAVLANPEIARYHSEVMTESLSLTLGVAALVGVAALASAPSVFRALVLSLLIGASSLVRPTGVALIPAAAAAVLISRRAFPSRGALVAALIAVSVPAAAAIGVERLATERSSPPEAETSLAPRHLFAKAALIDAPAAVSGEDDTPLRRSLRRIIEVDAAPIRALLADPDASSSTRAALTVNYETCLEYACAAALMRGISAAPGELRRETTRVALERMAAAPAATARLFLSNYLGLWDTYSRSHPDLAPSFDRFVATRTLPFADLLPSDMTGPAPISRAAIAVRPAIRIVGLATFGIALFGIPALVRGTASPEWTVAVFSALAVHLSDVTVAALGVGIPRYTLGLWPFAAAAGVYALAAFRASAEQVRPREPTRKDRRSGG